MSRASLCFVCLVLASAPLSAQNVPSVKAVTVPKVSAVQIDYKQQWEQELAKNRQLRDENTALRAQLDEWTRKGGSLVHAYCANETESRNSAGAQSDCAASGYRCEPVSGLCRTVARSSDDCAPGFLMDGDRCVLAPR